MLRTPESLLVDLLAAAGVDLDHDEPFWYAVDRQSGTAMAQGTDPRRVAHEALVELRRQYDALATALAAAADGKSRAVGGPE
jgi:hypothetical protein